MRRLLSMLLMAVLGLPLVASAFGGARAMQLPACCRRGGAHHCMEMADMGSAANDKPALRMTCPAFPRGAASVATGVWSLVAVGTASGELVTQPAVVGQVEAGYRISFGRARQKRGPPTQNS
jgi:hypothetical protein